MTTRSRGELLTHPLLLTALACWALNDHYGKRAHPGWLSGKLSDVACLIVIPIVVGALAELISRRRATAWVSGAALLAAIAMALINTSALVAECYEVAMGALQWPLHLALGRGAALRRAQLTMDPSDLVTLPAALLPVLLERRRWRITA